MDIKKIISTTRNYNFHSHTQFCDGRADMHTMAAAAVACGMEHYAFTPHSPIPIESPCNMSADAVEAYLAEAASLKNDERFASCKFYTGMEIDYLGKEWCASSEYFKNLPLDFTISSVHFIPTQDGDFVDIDGRPERFKERMAACFRNDIEYVVHTFFEQTKDMIMAGGFDILGHFDKISHNASYFCPGITESKFYNDCLGEVLKLVIQSGTLVELNTKARKEFGYLFPSEKILPILIENGITIVVNSDAHYPDKIDASRAEAFEILDSIHGASNA